MASSPQKPAGTQLTEDELTELIGEAFKHLDLTEEDEIFAATRCIREITKKVSTIYELEQKGLTRSNLKEILDTLKEHAESIKIILKNQEVVQAIERYVDVPVEIPELLDDLISGANITIENSRLSGKAGSSRAIIAVELPARAQLVIYAEALFMLCNGLKKCPSQTDGKFHSFLDTLLVIVDGLLGEDSEKYQDWRWYIKTTRNSKGLLTSIGAHLSAWMAANDLVENLKKVIKPKNSK